MSEPHAVAYGQLRARVCEVVLAVPASALDKEAPATPSWRVHDIVAHLVGVTDDVVHGRLEGIASDPWTQAQVDARADVPVAEMLAEWDEHSPQFEAMLGAAPGEIAGQAIFDAATHEHDLRHAVGAPGGRDVDAIALAWDWILDARTRGGAHCLCFVTEAGEEMSGTGELIARIEAPRFELFRAVAGRRTAAEIEQYGWDITPKPELILGSEIFTLRAEPLGE